MPASLFRVLPWPRWPGGADRGWPPRGRGRGPRFAVVWPNDQLRAGSLVQRSKWRAPRARGAGPRARGAGPRASAAGRSACQVCTPPAHALLPQAAHAPRPLSSGFAFCSPALFPARANSRPWATRRLLHPHSRGVSVGAEDIGSCLGLQLLLGTRFFGWVVWTLAQTAYSRTPRVCGAAGCRRHLTGAPALRRPPSPRPRGWTRPRTAFCKPGYIKRAQIRRPPPSRGRGRGGEVRQLAAAAAGPRSPPPCFAAAVLCVAGPRLSRSSRT